VLDAVFWLIRTGAPWQDLPEEFGNWNSIFRQFRRWASRRVVTRYDKLAESFAAFVLLACISIWIKFVHAA
jgi:transposase